MVQKTLAKLRDDFFCRYDVIFNDTAAKFTTAVRKIQADSNFLRFTKAALTL